MTHDRSRFRRWTYFLTAVGIVGLVMMVLPVLLLSAASADAGITSGLVSFGVSIPLLLAASVRAPAWLAVL